jgi:hypothetical protein
MAASDTYLYPGYVNPSDDILSDPTVVRSGGAANYSGNITQADNTLTATAQVIVTAAANLTQANQTLSATGTVSNPGGDLTINPVNMQESVYARRPREYRSGEAISQCEVVYIKASDSRVYKADANITAAQANALGVALQTVAGVNQRLQIVEFDPLFVLGAALVTGTAYILSATPGKIGWNSDAAGGWNKNVLMVAVSTTEAQLAPSLGGVI